VGVASADESGARRRILEAALDRFGRDGINRVTVRVIAADAGVSPALVVHYFGSMERMRRACDEYVMSMVRGPEGLVEDAAAGNANRLAGMLEATTPVRRYLARAFVDGSAEAGALFDEIVESTQAWLAGGEREGWVRPSENPRTRAVVYVSWLLAPLAFDAHLARVLGVDDLHGIDSTLRMSRVGIDMLTHGVFTDERMLQAWDAVLKERGER
jgi:AcrR family transcriptional regulator